MHEFGTSLAQGRRLVPRIPVPLIAVLSTAAGDHPAKLMDISRTGARLCAEMLPIVGEQLTFRAEDVEATANVVWSTGHKCGVEFATPIASVEVERLRRLGSLTSP